MTHGNVLNTPPDCDAARFVDEAATVVERHLALGLTRWTAREA